MTNQYEDYDYAAMQEAEAILNGTIPSTPETYAMVQKFYGSETTQGLAQGTKPVLAKQGRDRNVRGQDARLFRNLRAESGTQQRP